MLDVVSAFETASGTSIPYDIVDRRPGDATVCFSDVSKAKAELGWVARNDIAAMCADAWCWQSKNPRGYEDA